MVIFITMTKKESLYRLIKECISELMSESIKIIPLDQFIKTSGVGVEEATDMSTQRPHTTELPSDDLSSNPTTTKLELKGLVGQDNTWGDYEKGYADGELVKIQGNKPVTYDEDSEEYKRGYMKGYDESECLTEADMLGATTRNLPPDEMQAYLDRIKSGEKLATDKYKMPFVHGSNIEIKDESDKSFDLAKLKSAITTRPEKLLKQNEKITHSSGDSTIYFNIGLPALKGLAVNEKTGEFVVVDTCPGAGACKVYCYAKKGGYVQWKASSMSQTRILNFLLNDPEGFKNKLSSELKEVEAKLVRTNTKKSKKNGGDVKTTKVVIRWHDAGDFFSPDYLELAYGIARSFSQMDFYAYTKMASVSKGDKPSNFKINFSGGSTPDQEKQIDFTTTKHSTVVPREVFDDLVVKDEKGKAIRKDGKIQFEGSNLNMLKKRMSVKYRIPKDSIITYDEMMNIPEGSSQKYNVIVRPGDGDNSANRSDVLGTYLFIH